MTLTDILNFLRSPGGGTLAAGGLASLANLYGSSQLSGSLQDASQMASAEQRLMADQLARERASQEARFLSLLDFTKMVRQEEAPFRDLQLQRGQFGASFLPTLRDVIDNPTLSSGFQLAAKEGVDLLRRKFARRGSPSSGPAQVASGRFLEGLTSRELDRFNQNLFSAVGLQGTPAQSQAPQLASSALGSQLPSAIAPPTGLANFALQQGQSTANLFGNLGNTISQLPLQYAATQYLREEP